MTTNADAPLPAEESLPLNAWTIFVKLSLDSTTVLVRHVTKPERNIPLR